MKTPANDRGSDEPTALSADPVAAAEAVETGDDTREIPLAAMKQILDS